MASDARGQNIESNVEIVKGPKYVLEQFII